MFYLFIIAPLYSHPCAGEWAQSLTCARQVLSTKPIKKGWKKNANSGKWHSRNICADHFSSRSLEWPMLRQGKTVQEGLVAGIARFRLLLEGSYCAWSPFVLFNVLFQVELLTHCSGCPESGRRMRFGCVWWMCECVLYMRTHIYMSVLLCMSCVCVHVCEVFVHVMCVHVCSVNICVYYVWYMLWVYVMCMYVNACVWCACVGRVCMHICEHTLHLFVYQLKGFFKNQYYSFFDICLM